MLNNVIRRKVFFLFLLFLFLNVSGCGVFNTLRYYNIVYERNYPDTLAPSHKRGVFHIVEKGETIYRIAKTYRLSPSYLQRVNRISHPEKIPLGYKLWIPGAKQKLKVTKYYARRIPKIIFAILQLF